MNYSNIIYHRFKGNAEEWNCTLAAWGDSCLLQTWEFGEAKAKNSLWSVERGLLLNAGSVVGAAQSMIRKPFFSNSGLVWINRGPVGVTGNYGEALRALHQNFCVKQKMYLRVAPSVAVENLSEAEYNSSGLIKTKIQGWASAIIDLAQPIEILRNNLHGKWRNALGRAERSNIDICISNDKSSFGYFLKGHCRHLDERGQQGGLEVDFLDSLEEILPKHRRLICVQAYKDGNYLGGALISQNGTVAEYLAGHNSGEGRLLNAGQLVLWSAIVHLKSIGMIKFDLGGMDERLTPNGIYRFKQRIGGAPYRLANEMEGLGPGLINRIIRRCVDSQRRRNHAKTYEPSEVR